MRGQCFDEGTIQSFLDGELASDLLEQVARHVALCDECTWLLQKSEEESVLAFNILGEEFNTLVPTERIRANIYQAISQLEAPKIAWWQKVFGFVFSLSNPSFVAFASILLVFSILAAVWSLMPQTNQKEVATSAIPKVESSNPIPSKTTVPMVDNPVNDRLNPPKIVKVANKPELIEQKPKTKDQKPKTKVTVETPLLDGEATYLKTIATLETTVNAKKDGVLRASSRISYERDMAVIDNSIKRMKEEVRKNPKNEAAKQILRNAYQNKIELLNSVSERSELMASLD